ncbi:MAG: putative flavoprotein involved in K+ transport [Bacteriovoracaceae bacterium]
MSESNIEEIIIIGAGPSGLSLAYHLREIGLRPLVLEAGENAGSSFENMPDFLALISYWKSNYLIKKDRFYFKTGAQVHSKEFAKYLQDFPSRFGIKVQTSCLVQKVERVDQVYSLETSKGRFQSRIIVNCTGYYSSPFYPNFPGLQTSKMLKLHFKEYKNKDSLKGSKKILVVGSRLSAGQILLDLESEDIELNLSSRSKINSMVPSFFLRIILFFIDHLEKPLEFISNKRIETTAPMFHEAKSLIKKGRVKLYPSIKSFHDNSVSFVDGATTPFDAVILATGFTPQLDYLGNLIDLNKEKLPLLSEGFEALYTRNLFFLGLDHQQNVQSRFLRGIRNDAKKLSVLISERLKI